MTNKIYVANFYANLGAPKTGSITVIDGATNSTTTVASGSLPFSVAVNPVTNKIYFSNQTKVTVIDGATNSTTDIVAGTNLGHVAVDPLTNKIYATDMSAASDVVIIDGATNAVTTVVAGDIPNALAVNPVTNKVYVANSEGKSVSVIDGANYKITTVSAGSYANALAVNAVTDKIYVANNNVAGTVTVIDGPTTSTATVKVGSSPASVAVNPVTNKIYVANEGRYPSFGNTVTVIDGATNNTTTVVVGQAPVYVAVNAVTNKIYVANFNAATVTVIDGATNSTTTVATGFGPAYIAVNPVTNKIYVTNEGNGVTPSTVTVIDGATNAATNVTAGLAPFAVAVNTVTNQIYVANQGHTPNPSTVTVIDGGSNSTTTLPAGTLPSAVAVNSITNKIYVANFWSGNVTVIDGASNETTSLAVGGGPNVVAVNPVTNKIYVSLGGGVAVIDGASNSFTTIHGIIASSVAVNPATKTIYVPKGTSSEDSVAMIEEEQKQFVPLTTNIAPLVLDETDNPAPSFTFTAQSGTLSVPSGVFFQIDTWQSQWSAASGSNPTFQSTVGPLQPGFHILFAYAGDAQEASSTQVGSPLIGEIQAYGFLVTAPGVLVKYSGLDSGTKGNWTGNYGANGGLIAKDANQPPAYAVVTLTGDSPYTWAASTSDVRALQKSSGSSSRIASTYYSATSFTIGVNLTDGNTHRIALYLLDWDSTSRAETISILEASSHVVLDTETFSGFHNGQYASWDIQGNVLIQVTKTGGANAVVSGIFFDPAIAASAGYIGSDTTTQGTWTGEYGGSGEWIANDLLNPPTFATVSLTGDKLYTWAASTTDKRALQTAGGSSTRIASTYYSSSSFMIDLNLRDGNTHKISLYLLDWDSDARAEVISILDADSNALLSTETFSNFDSGEYAEWEVQGHVSIQVTKTGGANAVVSGIFVD